MVSTYRNSRLPRRLGLLAGVALAMGMGAQRAAAYDTTQGDWEVSIDTTLSSSADFRASGINDDYVGYANGGKWYLPNADNGDLNFKSGGIVAATQRLTNEISIKQGDEGLFVRTTAFYDPIYDSTRLQFQQLSTSGREDIGASARLLDAYVYASPTIGNQSIDVRVGNQALNWGESTFIQFGINSITPLDVTALRAPGSELRTAFLPIPAADFKTEIVPDLSVETFWQPIFVRDRLEPTGSFFSAGSGVDQLYDGATRGLLFDTVPDAQSSVNALDGLTNPLGAAIARTDDRHPNGLDQFGIAIRKNVSDWNDAEFGLYFENYDSRTPFGSIVTGRQGSVIGSLFTALGLEHANSYTSTASYFADYPKDIHLVGFSWNFTAPRRLGDSG